MQSTEEYYLSVVIPTYNRGNVLLDTIDFLLSQNDIAEEIIVVDQTVYQSDETIFHQLKELNDKRKIIWVRLDTPSIPAAMNVGLLQAKSDYVLFLDDDVSFDNNFIFRHREAITVSQGSAHIGQILQPGEASEDRSINYRAGKGLYQDLSFPFRSNSPSQVHNCMAGNLLVTRSCAIECGGFDEQFSGAAYRFETEFCRRMIAFTGQPFYFAPLASLDHLKVLTGGTRAVINSFLTSSSPSHSQGDYYFAIQSGEKKSQIIGFILKRLFGCVAARFYLLKPWWIPARLIGEFRGLVVAIQKTKQGPKLIGRN